MHSFKRIVILLEIVTQPNSQNKEITKSTRNKNCENLNIPATNKLIIKHFNIQLLFNAKHIRSTIPLFIVFKSL